MDEKARIRASRVRISVSNLRSKTVKGKVRLFELEPRKACEDLVCVLEPLYVLPPKTGC